MTSIRRTYRSVALAMALVVLCSSVSFSMDMHFCQGRLKSVSLYGKAKNCHEQAARHAAIPNCPHHGKMAEQRAGCSEDRNCCSNHALQVNPDLDRQFRGADPGTLQQHQGHAIVYAAQLFLSGQAKQQLVHDVNYKPPWIVRDVPVLLQTFLL